MVASDFRHKALIAGLRSLGCFLILLTGAWQGLQGQDLSGQWTGVLLQDGKEDALTYRLHLAQAGRALSGAAVTVLANGRDSAVFQVTGVIDSGLVVLQELRQVAPESPAWCMKYARLKIEGPSRLSGRWEAPGCTPGRLTLQRAGAVEEVVETIPFSITGRWTGALSQSDRDYGFYFEIELLPGGQGYSYIVSEGNGGSARHALSWSFDSMAQVLRIREEKVVERTEEKWKWCIKNADLTLEEQSGKHVLQGSWEGRIEGANSISGRCAPGRLLLEKPILTRTVQKVIETAGAYDQEGGRQVKVERIVEVQSDDLLLKIWDNGTVDGDMATLFLNGERLIHRYRVTKRKASVRVRLQQTDNFLILHAEDLGEVIPNTVAISIDDGITEQVLIVSSNLRESGAVLIKRIDRNP